MLRSSELHVAMYSFHQSYGSAACLREQRQIEKTCVTDKQRSFIPPTSDFYRILFISGCLMTSINLQCFNSQLYSSVCVFCLDVDNSSACTTWHYLGVPVAPLLWRSSTSNGELKGTFVPLSKTSLGWTLSNSDNLLTKAYSLDMIRQKSAFRCRKV